MLGLRLRLREQALRRGRRVGFVLGAVVLARLVAAVPLCEREKGVTSKGLGIIWALE